MREPEFLPPWYPILRRRRRLLIAQAWATGAPLLALVLLTLSLHRGINYQRATLDGVNQQLVSTDTQLHRLSEIELLTGQLEQQDDIVRRLGTYVPAARLINVLSEVMPKEMALVELSLNTDEEARGGAPQTTNGPPPIVDHRLHMRVVGVTPTDVELSTFIGGVASIPYFSDMQSATSQDRVDSGHLMRQFDVTFTMDLDPGMSPEAAAR